LQTENAKIRSWEKRGLLEMVQMNHPLSQNLKKGLPQVIELIRNTGFFDFFDLFPQGEFYLVGGVVRDLMLGKKTQDLDLVVRKVALPDLEEALKNLGKVQVVGKNFGVLKWAPKAKGSGVVDIALPRTEKSKGLRGVYREFIIDSDPNLPMEEDLNRRDFTVNAMALDLRTEKVLDPFGGSGDLTGKKLRAVGDPRVRFQEDYSRILRGIRFACQLGFEIEEETWMALKGLISGLVNRHEDESFVVPREVIGKEMVQALTYDPVKAFDLFGQSGAMEIILPEILSMKGCPQPKNFHSEGDVWTHTRLALAQLSSPTFRKEFPGEPLSAELVLSVLLHDLGKPHTLKTPERDGTDRIRFDGHDRVGAQMASKICRRLKLSQYPKGDLLHVDSEDLSWLVGKHLILVQGQVMEMKATTIERYFLKPGFPGKTLLQLILADSLATIHEDGFPNLTSYYQVKERITKIQKKAQQFRKVPAPFLNGEDVMRIYGVGPGPQVGEILSMLREEQLTGRVKSRKEAITFLNRSKGNPGDTKKSVNH